MPYPLPDLNELAEALRSGERPLAMGGIVPGARALVLASLLRTGWPAGRCLVVVPHATEAADLAAGIRLLAPEVGVAVVPAEGAATYQGTEPPLASRLELVRLLAEIESGAVQLIIVPARMMAVPIPVPEAVAARTIHLERGDRIETNELARRLAESGYRRVDLVEEAGEFAVRGWVVDLHLGGDAGIRVELDDDSIERIQAFDPSTQRSCGEPAEAVAVSALDPFPADGDSRRAIADELQGDYQVLAGLIREGAERRLWWGALHLASKWTSWPEVTDALVVCDRDDCLGEMARWARVLEREW